MRVPVGSWILIKADSVPPSPEVHFMAAGTVPARRIRGNRVLVKVPIKAKPGPIRLRSKSTWWSVPYGLINPVAADPTPRPVPTGSALDGNGMWIWELRNTEHGDTAKIIAKAKLHDVTTLYIKAGDGTHNWAQFTTTLIRQLHAAGLQVCAWPYVYGKDPKGEAAMTVRAIQLGADCLTIDAETEYEGRYSQALTYITAVRKAVGAGYPLSLAGYPYVDYHPSFPFSVFFGPGMVQYSQPQVYWRDIGKSVDTVLKHTWSVNSPYGKPIMPLGQLWQTPKAAEVLRFRSLSAFWGAPGVSWWDWQEAPSALWAPVGSTLPWPSASTPKPDWITIASSRSKDDLARWAQMHLNAAGAKPQLALDGSFGPATRAAVIAFQTAHSLPATGSVGTSTWKALLRVKLPLPAWAKPAHSSSVITSDEVNPNGWGKSRNEFRVRRSH